MSSAEKSASLGTIPVHIFSFLSFFPFLWTSSNEFWWHTWKIYRSHCLDLDLNGFLTRRNFWRIPGMLGNYTMPKWKEFLKSREPILRKSFLSTFIHINRHMDRARDIFWIKSLNGTFLALQIKAFGPKKFWFLPMHENQKFFGPNAFTWSAKKVQFSDFIQNMSLALSMCLFMWIKVDK